MARCFAAAVILVFTCLAPSSFGDVEMRWCHTANEKVKCDELATQLSELAMDKWNMTVNASCVQAVDATECMDKIEGKKADVVVLDSGHILMAGKDHNMELVVAEDYGQGAGTAYYAVAVVKKGSTFSIKDLKGKNSCHTGAGRSAGWVLPVGFLLSKGIMKRTSGDKCNPFVDAGNFFAESCVPGALTKKFDPNGMNPKNLCEICNGTGEYKCSMSGKEPYFGYDGALLCLAQGKGQVAFVKHVTVSELTEADPAKYGNMSDYEYLCPDGTRRAIGEHIGCNLAKSPSHAVMTWSGNEDRADYIKLLVAASMKFGPDSVGFQMFNSSKYGGKDLLFKDSTKKLLDVGDKKSYKAFLEKKYLDDVAAIHKCVKGPKAAAGGVVPFLSLVVFSALAFFAAI